MLVPLDAGANCGVAAQELADHYEKLEAFRLLKDKARADSDIARHQLVGRKSIRRI